MDWIIKWVDPSGVETVLTDPPNCKVTNMKGINQPSFRPITSNIPLKPGSFLKHMDVGDTEIDMALLVTGSDQLDLWSRLNSLVNLFNPIRGNGTLKFIAPYGEERELVCSCISGFNIDETSLKIPGVARVNLVFHAFDPYWRSSQVYQQTASITGNPPQWFPIFPLRLGGDAVVSEFTVNNTGHVETYPTWVITGPGQNPRITNLTTGEFLGVSELYLITLESSVDKLTIDSEQRIVQDQTGTSYLEILDIKSSFFSLQPGSNTIRVEMPNATTDSSISLSYRLLYLGVV